MIGWMIEHKGWRNSLALFGLIELVLGFSTIWSWIHSPYHILPQLWVDVAGTVLMAFGMLLVHWGIKEPDIRGQAPCPGKSNEMALPWCG